MIQSQFINLNEVEDLCEEVLQSKFTDLMADLMRTQRLQAERTFTLTSLETVEAELNRKRAQRSRFPSPRC
jgi:hypothetical protein